MAGSDYYDCDNCGKGKVFYDSNVDWEGYGPRIGSIRVICEECFTKGVRLEIINTKDNFNKVNNWGTHCWTVEFKPEQSQESEEK